MVTVNRGSRDTLHLHSQTTTGRLRSTNNGAHLCLLPPARERRYRLGFPMAKLLRWRAFFSRRGRYRYRQWSPLMTRGQAGVVSKLLHARRLHAASIAWTESALQFKVRPAVIMSDVRPLISRTKKQFAYSGRESVRLINNRTSRRSPSSSSLQSKQATGESHDAALRFLTRHFQVGLRCFERSDRHETADSTRVQLGRPQSRALELFGPANS